MAQSLFWLMMGMSAPTAPDVAADRAPASEARNMLSAPMHEALDPEPQTALQVRIEQRLIIRVPRQSMSRSSLMALPAPRRAEPPEPPRFERKRIGKCLAMKDVTGVRVVNDDMLVLFTRDRRMIEADLERSCSAREFYQGFYMERSSDGRLCAERDLLQSRSGSKCEVERLRQLIPDE